MDNLNNEIFYNKCVKCGRDLFNSKLNTCPECTGRALKEVATKKKLSITSIALIIGLVLIFIPDPIPLLDELGIGMAEIIIILMTWFKSNNN